MSSESDEFVEEFNPGLQQRSSTLIRDRELDSVLGSEAEIREAIRQQELYDSRSARRSSSNRSFRSVPAEGNDDHSNVADLE